RTCRAPRFLATLEYDDFNVAIAVIWSILGYKLSLPDPCLVSRRRYIMGGFMSYWASMLVVVGSSLNGSHDVWSLLHAELQLLGGVDVGFCWPLLLHDNGRVIRLH
ncbi:hypothetical protein Dimus_018350, partial [Dionaea muscipula]